MGKNGKKVQGSSGDGDERLDIDDLKIYDLHKFQWNDEDVDGLVWLDDHEYTGTVPPSS